MLVFLAFCLLSPAWSLTAYGSLRGQGYGSGPLLPEEVADKVEEEVDKLVHQTQHTLKKASGHELKSPDKMVREDVNRTLSHLMPGKRPNFDKKHLEMLLSFLGIAWFVPFYMFLYKKDARDSAEPWLIEGQNSENKDANQTKVPALQPDFVLVFKNPGFEYSDNDSIMSSVPLQSVIVAEPGKLPRMDAMFERRQVSVKDMVSSKLRKSISGELNHRTYSEVRKALLQDLYSSLAHSGFDVSIFSSIDKDELFVCISLTDQATIQHQLNYNSIKLQIQKEVVSKLGIDQPPEEDESSPPLIAYDGKMATNILGTTYSDVDFYQGFYTPTGEKTILSSTHRVQIILAHLHRLVNLDKAVSEGLLSNWYAAHSFKHVQHLEQCWANWNLLKDVSCKQPLNKINEYFGARIAFMISWNANYTKALLALVPLAIVFEIINITVAIVGKNNYWERGAVVGFCLIVAVWSRVAMNLNNREEDYLASMWDLNESGNSNMVPRADFEGEWVPSSTDAAEEIQVYPVWKSCVRQFLTWSFTIFFCGFNMFVVTFWYEIFQGRMSPFASIILAIVIQIFTQTFNILGQQLTIWENHYLPSTFYKSYLQKMLIFQCVNRYSPFFYIAVKQQFTVGGCPADSCMGAINFSLPITLFCLMASRTAFTYAAAVQVEAMLWWEDYMIRRQGKEPPERSYVEKQGKYLPFNDREQVEITVELALALGFVLIFAAVAPRIVPMCFLVFLFQLRSSAVLLCKSSNRTVPRMLYGIGPMQDITITLMLIGCLFSGYLLVQFGPLFRGTRILTKMTGVVLWGIAVFMSWAVVDLVLPPSDSKTDILVARREYTANKATQKNSRIVSRMLAGQEDPHHTSSTPMVSLHTLPGDTTEFRGKSSHGAKFEDEVMNGNWSAIPGNSDAGQADPED